MLYVNHQKSRHVFHTTGVIPSKLILDVVRDFWDICFGEEEKEEEAPKDKKEETEQKEDKSRGEFQKLILRSLESNFTKLSDRLSLVEARCGRMETMMRKLLLMRCNEEH